MKILNKIKEYIKKRKDMWTMCLYVNNVLVKKVKVDEDYVPTDKFYLITFINKKQVIGTNKKTKMLCEFYKYKATIETKKEIHIELKINEGVDIR